MSEHDAAGQEPYGLPVGSTDRALVDVLAAWSVELRAAGRRPRTVQIRTGVVRAIYRTAGAVLVDELDDDAVLDYLARELAPASRRQYVTTWRAWCRYVGRPCELVTPRVPRGLPRPARGPQLAAAQLAAAGHVGAWIACGRWAGLRAGEVARLRGDDVDLAGGVLYVDGKGGQRGVLPLHPRLGDVLAPWVAAAGAGPLWDVTAKHVSAAAGAVLRAHGAAERFHQLRHYYGTEVYRSSGDVLRAQRALRHASPTTTTIYAQLVDDDLAAAIGSVP